MVDSKKSKSAATHLPSKALVRIIRAAERRAPPEEAPAKPARTAVPVEVLAGRVRHAPRGRFVTGGRVEFAGQDAATPKGASEACEEKVPLAQKRALPRARDAERRAGRSGGMPSQKKSGVGAAVRHDSAPAGTRSGGREVSRGLKKAWRPSPATEGLLAAPRTSAAGGKKFAAAGNEAVPRQRRAMAGGKKSTSLRPSAKNAPAIGQRPRSSANGRTKIPARGLKPKRK